MLPETFKHIASSLPTQPGIYKYYDNNANLIYVGKAKHIRKRVSSYFTKQYTSYKTKELVTRIERIEFTITNNEQDAFLLENALIKEYKPKYNINLKDDKTYPYIVIKKEPFPRVFLTRKKIKDGSEYLGPFTNVSAVRDILIFIKNHVQLRTCKLSLTEPNIKKGKFKVCLEYHLGNCKGPCEALQDELDYQEGLKNLKQIVKGNITPVVQYYKTQMQQYAQELAFEKAAIIKKKLEHLENYKAKTTIVNNHIGNVDVFTMIKEGDKALVNYLMVYDGTIIQTHNTEVTAVLEENETAILTAAIGQIRTLFESTAQEIIVPIALDVEMHDIIVTIPQAGVKKQLLDLSLKNAEYFKNELRQKQMLYIQHKTEADMLPILQRMQQQLNLPAMPLHIECFDNSNFQGSFPVSAMVCFKNGLPSKADYRHFNVKTVVGINDFATMHEAVSRRYKRCIDEQLPLPQLVIIDGGKGQLSAAYDAIKALSLQGQMTLVGLAKNIEELFFVDDSQSIQLNYYDDALKLIRNIRDEVHRFGITFHRNKRSKGTFKNELEDIQGIGKRTAEKLLKHFKSVKKIKEASTEDIMQLAGASVAQKIKNHYNNT